jgi:hypothetical protein
MEMMNQAPPLVYLPGREQGLQARTSLLRQGGTQLYTFAQQVASQTQMFFESPSKIPKGLEILLSDGRTWDFHITKEQLVMRHFKPARPTLSTKIHDWMQRVPLPPSIEEKARRPLTFDDMPSIVLVSTVREQDPPKDMMQPQHVPLHLVLKDTFSQSVLWSPTLPSRSWNDVSQWLRRTQRLCSRYGPWFTFRIMCALRGQRYVSLPMKANLGDVYRDPLMLGS